MEKKDFVLIHKTGFRLLKMVHKEDSSIIPIQLLGIVLSVCQVYVGLFLTADFIDALIGGEYENAWKYALALLLTELFFGLVVSILRRKFRGMETRMWLLFYVWIRKKAFALDYDRLENPEVSQKILFLERTSEMYGGLGMVIYYYRQIVCAVLQMAASVAMVFYLCMAKPEKGSAFWQTAAGPVCSFLLLGSVLFGIIIVSLWLSERFAKKRMEMFNKHTGVEEKLSYLSNSIFMNYQAGKVIRIFGMESMLMKNASSELRKSRDYFKESTDVNCQEGFGSALISSLFTWFTYLFVILKTAVGAITLGAFTKYAGALAKFASSCADLIEAQMQLRQITTYMTEFLAFLDLESRHVTGTIPVEKRQDGEYVLAFEDVSFCYPGSSQLVLKHVNCRLNLKKKMAVVGKNGAGKTTFIKLLCRLYEPTEGKITLNGVDIRKYDEEEYRDLFGVVFQDFKLFSFTVGENIAAGYERVEENIWKALEKAGVEDVVKQLPCKVDTKILKGRGGVDLSGGEIQKLALARALYKDAPVVILDEPTAALDPVSEAAIYESFDEMVKEKTSIYISHRMSSCRFCDDIIVFDEGKIAERGSHDELLSQNGLYTALWGAQAKYYV